MSDPLPIPTLKAAPAMLEYRSVLREETRVSHHRQAVFGFGAWFAGVAVLVGLMSFALQSENPLSLFLVTLIPMVGEVVGGLYVALRRGWLFFVVGQLVGMAVSGVVVVALALLT